MAELKGQALRQFLARPSADDGSVFLIYGPDVGAVSETASRLAESTGVDLADPFQYVRLDALEVDDAAGRLLGEARTISMFGGKRLIRIGNCTNDKALCAAVTELVDEPSQDSIIILEAGNLKPKTGLRGVFAKTGRGVAVPCYADQQQDISRLIDETFQAASIRLDNDARHYLSAHLGGDRGATRSELEKITLYLYGQETATVDDIRQISGDASALGTDDILDHMISGKVMQFDRLFARYVAAGNNLNALLFAAQSFAQRLEELKHRCETERKPPSAVIETARPPIFFARKQIFTVALSIWTPAALHAMIDRLDSALLEFRRSPAIGEAVVHRHLVRIAEEARRRTARR